MKSLPDFDDADRRVVESAPTERYARIVRAEPAEAVARLDPGSDEITLCPTLYWEGATSGKTGADLRPNPASQDKSGGS